MQLFKTPHIQFLKYKYIALAVTAVIVVAGVLNVTVFKGLKLGVDFGEGTLLRVMIRTPVERGRDPRPPPGRRPRQERSPEDGRHAAANSRSGPSRPSTPRPPSRTSSRPTRSWPTRSSTPCAGTTARRSGPAASSTSTRSTSETLTGLLEGGLSRLGPRRGPEDHRLTGTGPASSPTTRTSPGSASSPRSCPSSRTRPTSAS